MRIHVMSDIHFEHMLKEHGDHFFGGLEKHLKKDPAQVLVLAGDICQIGQHEYFWMARIARLCGMYHRVIYVPGNHEYYKTSFREVDRFFESIEGSPNFANFINLDAGSYTYGTQRFIGNTMWFPDRDAPGLTKQLMGDFLLIGSPASPFEPEVYERHEDFRSRVLGRMTKNDVVVTHHTPLKGSIHPYYEGSRINQFFCADIESQLKEETLPKLWIHGHTHHPFDYIHTLGQSKMRVYCNPLGYPHEGANDQFFNRIGVDIPD